MQCGTHFALEAAADKLNPSSNNLPSSEALMGKAFHHVPHKIHESYIIHCRILENNHHDSVLPVFAWVNKKGYIGFVGSQPMLLLLHQYLGKQQKAIT